jgi:hypothetical protein
MASTSQSPENKRTSASLMTSTSQSPENKRISGPLAASTSHSQENKRTTGPLTASISQSPEIETHSPEKKTKTQFFVPCTKLRVHSLPLVEKSRVERRKNVSDVLFSFNSSSLELLTSVNKVLDVNPLPL